MYFQYGAYQHPLNECAVAITKEPVMNDEQIPYMQRIRWAISGYLQSDDQTDLTAVIQALEAAYAKQGQNAGLYLDNGTPTAHILTSSQMVGGVRVVDGISYPDGSGAEYSTFRHYQIHLEALYPTKQIAYVEYSETLSFTGTGGPRIIFLEVRNGPPQQQMVSQATVCTVTQQGRAVGYGNYPPYPTPIWPQAEMQEERRITPKTPKYTGMGASRLLTEFPIEWSYTFKSASQLIGLPSRRPAD